MEMDGKRLFTIIGIILILGGWIGSPLAAELKIGCVDMPRAMNECNAGKEAKKTIGKEMEKLQHLFAERQKELQTMKETLEKQAPMLAKDARATKEKEFQDKVRDYQRWLEDNQKEIQQKGLDMEKKILGDLQKVIQKMGTDEGYTVVLAKNENIVLFASKAIEVTDRVIKIYDAQKK
jgi:outer membrane protein